MTLITNSILIIPDSLDYGAINCVLHIYEQSNISNTYNLKVPCREWLARNTYLYCDFVITYLRIYVYYCFDGPWNYTKNSYFIFIYKLIL
jgi:hypothetical protein